MKKTESKGATKKISEKNIIQKVKAVTPEFKTSFPALANNPNKWTNRLVISTPTLGMVRMEWVQARFGQTIPTNFSLVDVHQFMSSYAPVAFQVADAENLTAKVVVEGNFDWFLSWEDDNLPPLDALVKVNEYIIKRDTPIVSGLYFTKSVPPEPILYRGMGTGYYADWKMGEKVWVDGVPFGFNLIHGDIIRALWNESPEYIVNGTVTRRVFDSSSESYVDPDTGGWMNSSGTSDLAWCKRIMKDNIFEKAGWPEYQKKEYPFLVDTSIFVRHIDRKTGVQYPTHLPKAFLEGKITFRDALKILTA
ncbi:MAG: hypothetical protein NUV96_00775 [Candidatus Colwellbacteria bacterium]|nr:hypothetical protein [Candidatus Colwellbacteria bacterium]